MKTLKFVTFSALVILIIQIGLTISIPFRFPGDSVAWNIVISTDLLLGILCVLLFMIPKLRKNDQPKVIFSAILISVIFTLIGWTPWIFMVPFIIAILGIYLVSSRIRT